MDKIISTLAGFGIPGLILLGLVAVSPYAGAAAIIASLVWLGPGGIIGGIATLGVIGLVSKGITEFGFDVLAESLIGKLIENGYTVDQIIRKINSYPITYKTKLKLIKAVKRYKTA